MCVDLLAETVEHSREFGNFFESCIGQGRRDVAQVAANHQQVFGFSERSLSDVQESCVLLSANAL